MSLGGEKMKKLLTSPPPRLFDPPEYEGAGNARDEGWYWVSAEVELTSNKGYTSLKFSAAGSPRISLKFPDITAAWSYTGSMSRIT